MPSVELDLYRHGHTQTLNDLDVVIGQSLLEPLDELGEQEALMLGDYMHREGLSPDIAYFSPAIRVWSTAELSLGRLGVNSWLPSFVAPGLVEQSMGKHEGKPRSEVYTPIVLAHLAILRADYRHPGGESMRDLSRRAFSTLMWAARQADLAGLQRVAAFTHNITISSVLAVIDGALAPDEMQEYILSTLRGKKIGTASRTNLVWERGQFRAEHVGEPTGA